MVSRAWMNPSASRLIGSMQSCPRIDTLRWLLSAAPGEELPDLVIVPHRPGRHEPRVVKDQMDTYTKMSRPRAELRKELQKKTFMA
jgi:hypothetical protein